MSSHPATKTTHIADDIVVLEARTQLIKNKQKIYNSKAAISRSRSCEICHDPNKKSSKPRKKYTVDPIHLNLNLNWNVFLYNPHHYKNGAGL